MSTEVLTTRERERGIEEGDRPIVVGVDGSPQSIAALRWAADQADHTGAPLMAVTAWHVHAPGMHLDEQLQEVPREAQSMLDATVVDALGAQRASTVEVRMTSQPPADALLELGREAELVVLGAHGGSGLPGRLLGSIPERVISYATGPVVVVRPLRDDHEKRVVVGLDGSPCSRSALAWALREARLTGCTVDAVVAWEWSPQYSVYPYGPTEDEFARAAERLLDGEMDRLGDEDRRLVTPLVVRGHAAGALTETARTGALLVVGSHGAGGGFRHLVGSVSLKCARHARVPMVVVHCAGLP